MLGWQALKTNPSKTGVQRALHCRCGREKILALGLCATCYTMKRQDDEYFGGLREQVLERDGYCCRVCGASGRRKRSIVVHHRVPGKSLLHLMISLCPGCHAKVGRTKVVLSQMPPLLLELWREQHPLGYEQTALDFKASFPADSEKLLHRNPYVPVPLFAYARNHDPLDPWKSGLVRICLRISRTRLTRGSEVPRNQRATVSNFGTTPGIPKCSTQNIIVGDKSLPSQP